MRRIAPFVGRQLSRFRMGQTYYAMILSTVNAVALVSLAFPVEFWMLILLFPVLFILTFLLGYWMDKSNVTAEDSIKSQEMLFRYVNLADRKAQAFQLAIASVNIEAFKAAVEKRPFDTDAALRAKYSAYLDEWGAPKSKKET